MNVTRTARKTTFDLGSYFRHDEVVEWLLPQVPVPVTDNPFTRPFSPERTFRGWRESDLDAAREAP